MHIERVPAVHTGLEDFPKAIPMWRIHFFSSSLCESEFNRVKWISSKVTVFSKMNSLCVLLSHHRKLVKYRTKRSVCLDWSSLISWNVFFRTVDIVPHHLHWNRVTVGRDALNIHFGQEGLLEWPITISVYIWACEYGFKTDLEERGLDFYNHNI